MKLTKEGLEELYDSMSLDEMASHLGIAKSTLYYNMRKLGVSRRSKSEAQVKHLKDSTHQRIGTKHSDDSKEKISSGTRKFWDSESGLEHKERLSALRQKEWEDRSSKQRSNILNRLRTAERPLPGQLSRFGTKLFAFLKDCEDVSSGIRLTPNHVSDIILNKRKVVIELLLPVAIYGNDQESKIHERYQRLVSDLNDIGYRVVIIEDRSNSISRARCQRVYENLLEFFKNDSLRQLTIKS